jgi:L-seryl-tRNA(Ser) seleniumtransferase
VRIAHKRGVAVLVDAAAEIYPLERMTWLAGRSGIDLVCFGGKYFGSVQSTGVLCGRRDLVEAASGHGFIGYETLENRSIGRGYKVDRQEIAATVVALREWFAADHAARFAEQERRIQTIARALDGLPGVTAEPTWPRQGAWMQLRVSLAASVGMTVTAVEQRLREETPGIWIRVDGDVLNIVVHALRDGEDAIVGERLRRVLAR